jgi:hypothetical protein
VVDGLRWCLPLKLQKFLPEVGGRLRPLLKLDVLRVHGVLEVDDPVGTDIHLLTSDVEQLTRVVSTHAWPLKDDGKQPAAHGPALKVEVHCCGGQHSHASASRAHVM